MNRFFSISSQQPTPQAVIDECMSLLEDAPTEANFGFLYATGTMAQDLHALLDACKRKTGIEHWVGTLGMGIIATGREIYDSPAAGIMLASFDANEFAMLPLVTTPEEITEKLTLPHEFEISFGIVHGDPFFENTQSLVSELQRRLHNGFLVGGLTSSQDRQFQIADEVHAGGISGAVFSEKVPVLSNLSQGCRPIGAKHRITQARENVAFTLDHKPALDVLMADAKIDDYEDLGTRLAELYTGLCIPNSDLSDYTVRNLVGIDIDHKVFAINDYMNEDGELLFCRRDSGSAVEDLVKMLDSMKKRLPEPPKGGLYVSCMARGREQFGDQSEEVKLIHESLGEFPLVGFFANGEIHNDKLYGYTGVLTLFM